MITGRNVTTPPTVHVICPIYNGRVFLPSFLDSLQAQTHAQWVLWVRDDGSSDDSGAIVRSYADRDGRIRVLDHDGERRGAAQAFRWLWDRIPGAADYVMFADQDDVWLPEKITRTLEAMRTAEAERDGAVLVHTDLVVVDAALREIAPSFWQFAGIDVHSTSLSRVVVRNMVTGNTAMINRALRECTGSISSDAVMHDWWVACVAAAFGRVVALPYASVLYRQHGANTIGVRRSAAHASWRELPAESLNAFARSAKVRADIAIAARQAMAFVSAYGAALPERDRIFLHEYARMPSQGFLRRKWDVVRMQLLPGNGLLRNVGLLLRA